jgi:hypothetical protein
MTATDEKFFEPGERSKGERLYTLYVASKHMEAMIFHAAMSPVAAALMRTLMSGSEYSAAFLSASTAKRGRLPVGQPAGLPDCPGFHDVARRPPPPLPRPGPVLAPTRRQADYSLPRSFGRQKEKAPNPCHLRRTASIMLRTAVTWKMNDPMGVAVSGRLSPRERKPAPLSAIVRAC